MESNQVVSNGSEIIVRDGKVSRSVINKILSEKNLHNLIKETIEQVGICDIKKLYFAHLPKDIIMMLTSISDDNNVNKVLEVFEEQLLKDNWLARIDQNVYLENDGKVKALWLDLAAKVRRETNLKRLDTESIYRMFVFYVRTITHLLVMMASRAMGVDLSDSNVSVMYGSLGTPGRISKMWVGKDIYDLTEPLSGRFAVEPNLVVFPAKSNEIGKPVTVTVTINAVCSHHLIRFGNEFGNNKSKAIISYIPREKVRGLSKINRWVEWTARRGWLQEELTKCIGNELMNRLNTNNIYVGLINFQHGCVVFRGKNDTSSYTTTEFYSGKYDDVNFREHILSSLS